MPDEATAAPTTEASVSDGGQAPTTEAPAQGGQGEAVETANLDPQEAERGYLRHDDYTRKTQELAEQRREFETQQQELEQLSGLRELVERVFTEQDEDAASELAEMFGYDPQGEGGNPEVDALKREVEEMRQWREELEQKEQEAQEVNHIRSELERLTGRPVGSDDDPEQDAIVAFSLLNRDGDKPLDLEGAKKTAESFAKWAVDRHLNGVREGNAGPDPSNLSGSAATAASAEGTSIEDRARTALERFRHQPQ